MSQSENITALAQRVGTEFKNYLPTSGGSMTGPLVMGNQHIQGANYIYGQQFNIGSSIGSTKPATEILIKQGGQIYSRTPQQILSDIGAASANDVEELKNSIGSSTDEDYGTIGTTAEDMDYGSI